MKIKKTYITSLFAISFTVLIFQTIYHFYIKPLQTYEEVKDIEIKITCNFNYKYHVMSTNICDNYLHYLSRELKLYLEDKQVLKDKHNVKVRATTQDPFLKIAFIYSAKYNIGDLGINYHLNKISSKYVEELKERLISNIYSENNSIDRNILFLSMLEYYRKENLNIIEMNPELLKLLSFKPTFDLISSLKKSHKNNLKRIDFYQRLDPNDTFSYKISHEDRKILKDNRYNTLNYTNIFLISFIFGIFISILISMVKNLVKLNNKESFKI